MKLRLGLVLAGLTATLALPASGGAAEPGPPPPGDGQRQGSVMALEVQSVDAGARIVTGVAHCVPPEQAGKVVRLGVEPAVNIGAFDPGTTVGVELGFAGGREVIVVLRPDFECNGTPRPGGNTGGGDTRPGDRPGGGNGDTRPGDKAGNGGGQNGGPGIPKGMFKKDLKLDVDLESFEAGVFGASLNKVLKGVPAKFASYLTEELKGDTFEVSLSASTKCFIDEAKVACSALGARVEDSARGVRATVLVRPLKQAAADDEDENEDDPAMAFRGKKIAVG